MSTAALASTDTTHAGEVPAQRSGPPLVYTGPYPKLFAAFDEDQQQELLEIYELVKRLNVPLSVVVGHLKGGVSKTTTVMYLALMLALFGEDVLVIDADPTNRQCVKWASLAPGSPRHLDVKAWAGDAGNGKHIDGREMVKLVRANRGPKQHLVIDTSPAFREYLIAGLQLCDIFLVASSPKPADRTELGKTIELAAQVEMSKGVEIMVLVLLALAKRNTRQLREALDLLETLGVSTFKNDNDKALIIGDSVDYSDSYCLVPTDFRDYVDIFRELIQIQIEAQEDAEREREEAAAL